MHFVKGLECEDLPPSMSSMIPHIQRAQYHSIKCNSSTMAHLKELDIVKYGYRLFENRIIPVMSVNPPAPDVVMNVVRCQCKKGCKTKACTCKKNSASCSEFCGCIAFGCSNSRELIEKPDDESEDFNEDFEG